MKKIMLFNIWERQGSTKLNILSLVRFFNVHLLDLNKCQVMINGWKCIVYHQGRGAIFWPHSFFLETSPELFYCGKYFRNENRSGNQCIPFPFLPFPFKSALSEVWTSVLVSLCAFLFPDEMQTQPWTLACWLGNSNNLALLGLLSGSYVLCYSLHGHVFFFKWIYVPNHDASIHQNLRIPIH